MPLDGSMVEFQANPSAQLEARLEALNNKTQECESELVAMQHEQEQFMLSIQEGNRRVAQMAQLQQQQPTSPELETKLQKEKEAINAALGQKCIVLNTSRTKWVEKQKANVHEVAQLQSTVLDDELIKWKRGQQLAGNGYNFDNNLEKIQVWCEMIVEIILKMRNQFHRFQQLLNNMQLNQVNTADMVAHLYKESTELLKNMVTSTFIIEKQPPQVMKTNTRFTSTVRLLVGGKLNGKFFAH